MEKTIKLSEEQARYIRAKIAIIQDDEDDDEEYWNDYEEDMTIERKKEKLWTN